MSGHLEIWIGELIFLGGHKAHFLATDSKHEHTDNRSSFNCLEVTEIPCIPQFLINP
jgi:hypothetical protein